MTAETPASVTQRWFHYGDVVEAYGDCWMGCTIGPVAEDVVPVPTLMNGLPLLGVWDHEPTVQEVDAVTPWDYRAICPACGAEGCDDEAHSFDAWHAGNPEGRTTPTDEETT